VLASREEIDDRNGSGKMLVGNLPNPFGYLPQEDLLLGAAPAALPDFTIKGENYATI
jgi:hypothetical protein